MTYIDPIVFAIILLLVAVVLAACIAIIWAALYVRLSKRHEKLLGQYGKLTESWIEQREQLEAHQARQDMSNSVSDKLSKKSDLSAFDEWANEDDK